MGKTIIISSNSDKYIGEKIDILKQNSGSSTIDTTIIDVEPKKTSIGISKMHSLKQWVDIKPYSGKNKIAIIYHAHLLTTEAQNSILKLLEEPHDDTTIVLVCDNYQSLLPTIVSRCQRIVDNDHEEPEQDTIEVFMRLDSIEKFDYIEKLEKEENKKFAIEQFLKMLLNYFRNQLLEKGEKNIIEKLKIISESKKMIDSKVPTKNVLDNLLIQLDL